MMRVRGNGEKSQKCHRSLKRVLPSRPVRSTKGKAQLLISTKRHRVLRKICSSSRPIMVTSTSENQSISHTVNFSHSELLFKIQTESGMGSEG
jgi:hypothetical protein